MTPPETAAAGAKAAAPELAILSGRTATVELLDRIRAEVGDDPAVWLPRFHQMRKTLA